jgi:hypothetical protein
MKNEDVTSAEFKGRGEALSKKTLASIPQSAIMVIGQMLKIEKFRKILRFGLRLPKRAFLKSSGNIFNSVGGDGEWGEG